MTGCLGLLVRLVVDALAVRIAQQVVKWLTGDHLRRLLEALLALFGIRIRRG